MNFPGTDSDDTIFGKNDENDIIWGFGGNDWLAGLGGIDFLKGGGGDDVLMGGEGADILNGGSGNDTALYADSDEGVVINLFAGTGSGGTAEGDTLVSIENVDGSLFNDTITGNNVGNELRGFDGNDTLKGFGGNDGLYGGVGNDTLLGGGGDDFLVGGADADILNGGSGSDWAVYTDSFVGVVVNLQAGTGSGGAAEGDTLVDIENVEGSIFNDTIIGNDVKNILKGNDGNDTLKGFGGDDYLYGGEDNDQLLGGAGEDRLFGENGNDQLWGGDENDHLYGGEGSDQLWGGLGNDFLYGGLGFDDLDGGPGEDTASYEGSFTGVTVDLVSGVGIGGDAFGDTLDSIENIIGSSHADTLFGNGFANHFQGGFGSDALFGGGGDDTLDGGAGADTIIGGEAIDTMTGGPGGDTFVWTGIESSAMGPIADVITDFSQPDGDLISVEMIDADTTIRGNQAFTFIGTAPFTAPGQINYANTATETLIYFNMDADNNSEMTIKLAGVYTVDASYFLL